MRGADADRGLSQRLIKYLSALSSGVCVLFVRWCVCVCWCVCVVCAVVCIGLQIHTCMYFHTQTRTRVHPCMYEQILINMHTHTHTQTHTHTRHRSQDINDMHVLRPLPAGMTADPAVISYQVSMCLCVVKGTVVSVYHVWRPGVLLRHQGFWGGRLC